MSWFYKVSQIDNSQNLSQAILGELNATMSDKQWQINNEQHSEALNFAVFSADEFFVFVHWKDDPSRLKCNIKSRKYNNLGTLELSSPQEVAEFAKNKIEEIERYQANHTNDIQFEVRKDGKLLFTGPEAECYNYIHQHSSSSVFHALQYEGWTITKAGDDWRDKYNWYHSDVE